MRPVSHTPNVTAGLKWPPLTAPSAETRTASARPWASATPSTPPVSAPWRCPPRMTAPMPTKKNRNVPSASAARTEVRRFGIGSSSVDSSRSDDTHVSGRSTLVLSEPRTEDRPIEEQRHDDDDRHDHEEHEKLEARCADDGGSSGEMAPAEGLEPPTPALGRRRSFH